MDKEVGGVVGLDEEVGGVVKANVGSKELNKEVNVHVRITNIPTGAKDITQNDDTYVCAISNQFCPVRDIGPHLPDNSEIDLLALFE